MLAIIEGAAVMRGETPPRQCPRSGGGVAAMADGSIGQPVRRREDYRFLTGQGTYTDDINRPGQLYAFILRSPHANARIDRHRHQRRAPRRPASSPSSPARTWRPTASAGCPAAG